MPAQNLDEPPAIGRAAVEKLPRTPGVADSL
jgi:hypothetical protein